MESCAVGTWQLHTLVVWCALFRDSSVAALFSLVSASATMNILLVDRLSYLNALYRHVDANRCCRGWINNKPDRSFRNPNSESPVFRSPVFRSTVSNSPVLIPWNCLGKWELIDWNVVIAD